MDSTSVASPIVEAGKPSRLPAGSTLLVNGIHVPHPHAEVNLAGAGDSRLGNTNAVTEFVDVTTDKKGNVTAELKSEPLHDEVRPRRLTTANDPSVTPNADGSVALGSAAPAELPLKTDPANKVVEVK